VRGSYFLRQTVPADLREQYGKREITKALGTCERRKAVVLCRRLGLELETPSGRHAPRRTCRPHSALLRLHPSSSTPRAGRQRPWSALLGRQWEAELKPDGKSIEATRLAIHRFTAMVDDIAPRETLRVRTP